MVTSLDSEAMGFPPLRGVNNNHVCSLARALGYQLLLKSLCVSLTRNLWQKKEKSKTEWEGNSSIWKMFSVLAPFSQEVFFSLWRWYLFKGWFPERMSGQTSLLQMERQTEEERASHDVEHHLGIFTVLASQTKELHWVSKPCLIWRRLPSHVATAHDLVCTKLN